MKNEFSDPCITRYLEDIRKTKPCNRKAEQELFRLCRQGNSKARTSLISANMRFVLKVALQYKGCPVPISDLVSEGAIGLVMAVENFDHTRGIKFISYAVWWIRSYITRAINTQSSLVRVPTNQCLRIRKALRESNQDKKLNEEIQWLIRIGERGCSLEEPVIEGSKTALSEVIKDDKNDRPDRKAEIDSIEKFTLKILEELPEREAKVLRKIYGIGISGPQTLREVAENLNMSHERVRQLREQAKRRLNKGKLKNILREKLEG